MMNMKTIDEWIEEFKNKIKEGYENNRMDKRLAEYANEVEKPARTLLKRDEPIRHETLPHGGTLIVIPTFKTRTVTPYNVGYRIDLTEWVVNPEVYGMTNYMESIGVNVALKEVAVMAKGMSDNTTNIIEAEQKGELTKEDIKKAREMVSGEHYTDTIVMPSKQRWRFLRNRELWEPHLIPTGYVPEKDRGPYYAGNISDARVYGIPTMKDFALVYSRKEIMVKNTPLKIEYYNRERVLVVDKWCSSAPIREEAVVKITL